MACGARGLILSASHSIESGSLRLATSFRIQSDFEFQELTLSEVLSASLSAGGSVRARGNWSPKSCAPGWPGSRLPWCWSRPRTVTEVVMSSGPASLEVVLQEHGGDLNARLAVSRRQVHTSRRGKRGSYFSPALQLIPAVATSGRFFAQAAFPGLVEVTVPRV